jgi:hypothetical protein
MRFLYGMEPDEAGCRGSEKQFDLLNAVVLPSGQK